MRVLRNPPLYKKAAASILERIQNKEFTSVNLPSEDNLAELLGTSKHTVREALAELASQSYISRRHGFGNVILNSVVDTKFRIDANMNFLKILMQAGYKTNIEYSSLRLENKSFSDLENNDYIVYDELVFANDDVASSHIINIPAKLFPDDFNINITHEKASFNLLDMLGYYNLHSIVEFIPELVDKRTAQLFSIEAKTPINTWEEYIYDQEDNLVCITKIRFNPKLFKLRMVRQDFKNIY